MKTTTLIKNLVLGISVLAAGANAMASSSKLSPIQTLQMQDDKGQIGVLVSGLSLYTFDPDNGAAQPACNATCAEKWPPVLVENENEIRGNDRLGIIVRASGLKQVTVDGKPVYTFYLDRQLGDVKGDGLGNVWHLVGL
ncbi:MAG TPA: hypothetical protein VM901_09595 [Bdellovibrionota bacterium]|jgi:predicted lipoprotein with Yx(FWY)xxD motif|nr:hypothetical protein [Bdellovibrionota bacterium]